MANKPSEAEQRASAILLPGEELKETTPPRPKRKRLRLKKSNETVVKLQQELGVTPDGKLGPQMLGAAGGAVYTVINMTKSMVLLPGSRKGLRPGGALAVPASAFRENTNYQALIAKGVINVSESVLPIIEKIDVDLGPGSVTRVLVKELELLQDIASIVDRKQPLAQEPIFKQALKDILKRYNRSPEDTVINLQTGQFMTK